MLFDSIKLVDGSEVINLVVDKGPTFPTSPDQGELFYNDGTGAFEEALYIYNGVSWLKQLNENTSLSSVLPNIVTPGSYKNVVVNSKGFVTAGSNPTTLNGFGITDAQPLSSDLTSIGSLSGTSGFLKKISAGNWQLDTTTYLTSNQPITLSGDVVGSGTNSITAALSLTGVAAGDYGTASSVPILSINDSGRITDASNVNISIDASQVNSGTFNDSRISASSVTQHQSSLSINESQIVNGTLLARTADNETISGNWSFNNPVSGVSPTLDTHLTTKSYVDNVAAGLSPHASVKAASTANLTLSGTQTVDGVALIAGDRILVKDQTTGSQNGVYIVASGAWSRATDFDGSPINEVKTGDLVFVEGGTTNSNTSWVIITTGTITVGSTNIQFSLYSRAGDLVAGTGLTKTGNTINVNTASSSRIVVNADNIDLAVTGVSAGTYVSSIVDNYGRVTGGSSTQSWATITGTPTTVSGYGITDALTTSYVPTWSSITGKPTTISGYGITDAQPLDADLTAIGALAGTTGLLKKTAANTWTLDTSSYLTSINSSQVTTALGYTPFNSASFTDTAVTGKLLTGFLSGAGTITSSDTILTAINKLSGNIGAAIGATNLTYSNNASTVTVVSDTGTDAVLPAATSSLAGVMSASDKTKLDSISTSSIPAINPSTPKDGDIQVAAGPIISIYAASAWRQIYPAVYS